LSQLLESEIKPTITAQEHYDRLAASGHGRDDPPAMQEYMARWDGPLFYDALGDPKGKDVLEIGIGGGRIARKVLTRGCRTLTGIDISTKTIGATRSDLANYPNLELVVVDICAFQRPESFDIVYSVLTFMHVQDKHKALGNVVDSLRPGGYVVLSIDHASDSVDFGYWKVDLHPWPPEGYTEALRDLGCETDELVPMIDTWSGPKGKRSETYGQAIATLVKARKP